MDTQTMAVFQIENVTSSAVTLPGRHIASIMSEFNCFCCCLGCSRCHAIPFPIGSSRNININLKKKKKKNGCKETSSLSPGCVDFVSLLSRLRRRRMASCISRSCSSATLLRERSLTFFFVSSASKQSFLLPRRFIHIWYRLVADRFALSWLVGMEKNMVYLSISRLVAPTL